MRNFVLFLLTGLCTWQGLAHAQDFDDDDDDLVFTDEQRPAPEPPRRAEAPARGKQAAEPAPRDPTPPDEPTDDDDIFFDDARPASEAQPFLDEEDDQVAREMTQPGSDTADLYRAQSKRVEGLGPDDEIMAWERYLKTYPNSMFKARIEARIDELYNHQYDQVYEGQAATAQAGVDLRKQEFNLVTGLSLPNLDPRRRIRVGAIFGYPFHMQAWADVEWAFLRKLSIHGGVWGRYQGWGLEVGLRGSPVKSAKDKVVLTPALDLRLNFGPLNFTVRPQLGVGKIFGDRVHLLANFGSEIVASKQASVGVYGDLELSVRVAQPVAIFVDAGAYARELTRAGGAFVFGDVGLGLRFFPRLKKHDADALQIDAGGFARSASRYLEYYQGAVALQGVYTFQSSPDK